MTTHLSEWPAMCYKTQLGFRPEIGGLFLLKRTRGVSIFYNQNNQSIRINYRKQEAWESKQVVREHLNPSAVQQGSVVCIGS